MTERFFEEWVAQRSTNTWSWDLAQRRLHNRTGTTYCCGAIRTFFPIFDSFLERETSISAFGALNVRCLGMSLGSDRLVPDPSSSPQQHSTTFPPEIRDLPCFKTKRCDLCLTNVVQIRSQKIRGEVLHPACSAASASATLVCVWASCVGHIRKSQSFHSMPFTEYAS